MRKGSHGSSIVKIGDPPGKGTEYGPPGDIFCVRSVKPAVFLGGPAAIGFSVVMVVSETGGKAPVEPVFEIEGVSFGVIKVIGCSKITHLGGVIFTDIIGYKG